MPNYQFDGVEWDASPTDDENTSGIVPRAHSIMSRRLQRSFRYPRRRPTLIR